MSTLADCIQNKLAMQWLCTQSIQQLVLLCSTDNRFQPPLEQLDMPSTIKLDAKQGALDNTDTQDDNWVSRATLLEKDQTAVKQILHSRKTPAIHDLK